MIQPVILLFITLSIIFLLQNKSHKKKEKQGSSLSLSSSESFHVWNQQQQQSLTLSPQVSSFLQTHEVFSGKYELGFLRNQNNSESPLSFITSPTTTNNHPTKHKLRL